MLPETIERIIAGIAAFIICSLIMSIMIMCILITPVQQRVHRAIESPDRITKPFEIVKS